jgi:glucose-6-phosphate isomerase
MPRWPGLVPGAGGTDLGRHFVGVTTNLDAAAEFGIHRTFGFWDWVGGRFSLWSAIGLPIAIAIGAENFRALLAGAHAMDRHFAEAPLAQNLPCSWGCWTSGTATSMASPAARWRPITRVCAGCRPICSSWRWNPTASRWTPWGALTLATSPVVWGEPGTNGQHAYFQMLHQGTDVVPVEFIAVKRPTHEHADLHTKLLANCLAQSQALMLGKTAAQAATERAPTASPDLAPEVLAQQRSFPGNRPSTTLLLDELTPAPWAP